MKTQIPSFVMVTLFSAQNIVGVASQKCSNPADLQCCNQLVEPNNPTAALLLGLLGIASTPPGLVGLNCSPTTVIGIGGTSCATQLACCTENNFNGLIDLGCTPTNG